MKHLARIDLLRFTLLALLSFLGCVSGQGGLQIGAITASGSVAARYTWGITKALTSGNSLEVPLTGSGTANYVITVTRTTVEQKVTVRGDFTVQNQGAAPVTPNPTVTFSTAPGGASAVASCSPPGDIAVGASTRCTFQASWTDPSVTAASSGTLTVTAATGETAQQQYNIAVGTNNGNCALLTDIFSGGTLTTAANAQSIQYSTSLSGLQVCDAADPSVQYTYTVTFSKLDARFCSTPATATNLASITPVGGASPAQTASQTLTLTVTGCQGARVTVANIKTMVMNTYNWAITKTGGGGSLTTTPDQELTIPFTITTTRTQQGTSGFVAGTVTVQNTAASPTTISTITVTVSGSPPATVPVSNCDLPNLLAQGSASCTFNVTNPSAPAAGTVTATVTLLGAGSAATSPAANFDYATATTFDLGGTATITDALDATNLNTIAGSAGGTALVRFEPADQTPPSTAPGLTLSDSRTFTYNLIVGRLARCTQAITMSNVATLTPQQGSTQGTLTSSAQATFTVTGCNVLPSVGLTNLRQWAAVTWNWQMQKVANPNAYQLQPGQGGQANFQVTLTRTRQSGNYWLSGTLRLNNPATFSMYISTVALTSTSGQFGVLPPNCIGGSNIGATTTGVIGTPGTIAGTVAPGVVGPVGYPTTGLSGVFELRAGAQINCDFNISAGTGSPPQGQIQAMATTATGIVSSAGNAAYSDNYPLNFVNPTQQWDIGGCVSFTDTASTTGFAGSWIPQLTGLPVQQQICESRTVSYSGGISAVPATGAICNTPVTITNNAQALPVGGGTAVTAQAVITVMATNCPVASPNLPPAPNLPLSVPSSSPAVQPAIATVNPGVAAASAGNYLWSVAISNSGGAESVQVPYSVARAVQYTVAATRTEPTASNIVTGQITVANPNTVPITISSVTANLAAGSAAALPPVAATCPTPLPVTLPAGGNVVCSFSAAVTSTDPGQVSAAVTSDSGGSSSQAVQYAFAAGVGGGAQGDCAVISDQLSSPQLQALGSNGSFSVSDNRPAGNTIKVCDDTTYSFTASFGPFSEADCRIYPVLASATVTPLNGPQAANPPTGQSQLNLEVANCPGQVASANDKLLVELDQPTATSNATYEWKINSNAVAPQPLTINYKEAGALQFNISWVQAATVTGFLSGSVTITNPTALQVNISAVMVQPEITKTYGTYQGAVPAVAAVCGSTQLDPDASTTCTYSTFVNSGGNGKVQVEVDLANNTSVMSSAALFSFAPPSNNTSAAAAKPCAEVTYGLMLGSLLQLPGAAGAISYNSTKACSDGGILLSQPIGPFKDDQCGTYSVASTVRVRPEDALQGYFSKVTPGQVTVTGCPLSEVPKPVATIAPALNVTNDVTYTWVVKLESSAKSPLVVQYNTPVDVVAAARVTRRPGQRSTSLKGSVQLMSQGVSTLTVSLVQAAALTRTGELLIVNATCPEDSIVDGAITIPPPPAKVLCPFNMSGLPPMDGPVTALVYAEPGSATPLPNKPLLYSIAKAPRNSIGDCVTVGSSRSMTKEGAVAALAGQPSRAGLGLPATPVCKSLSGNFTYTFGPFEASQCGTYDFDADLSADLTNSPALVTSDLTLKVQVAGCS